MEFLDKLILVVILGAVGALVLFLMRRVAREKDAMPRSADLPMPVEAQPGPARIDKPTAERLEPAIAVAPQPVTPTPSLPKPAVRAAKKKRKSAPVLTVPPPRAATPIVKVMGLLQEKDSLVAAFLLREILAPPVSRRPK
jgi:hypothetical protein